MLHTRHFPVNGYRLFACPSGIEDSSFYALLPSSLCITTVPIKDDAVEQQGCKQGVLRLEGFTIGLYQR